MASQEAERHPASRGDWSAIASPGYPVWVAVKKKRGARPRTSARARARKQERLVEDREKLALLEPGGSPERPLEVRSASVVEARAEAEECMRCDVSMRCEEHTTRETPTGLLRVAKLRCPRCGARRDLYLRIVESHLN